MLRAALAFFIIAIGLFLINGIFEFSVLITLGKICIVVVIILIIVKIISLLFGF